MLLDRIGVPRGYSYQRQYDARHFYGFYFIASVYLEIECCLSGTRKKTFTPTPCQVYASLSAPHSASSSIDSSVTFGIGEL